MKLLIEVPTWLGDAIMATPAIENLINNFDNVEVTIIGSFVSTQLFIKHPKVSNIIVDDTKNKKNRYVALFKQARILGKFDLAVSFRSSFTSRLFLFFICAKKKFNYKKIKEEKHQVLKYNDFINKVLRKNHEAKDLKLYFKSKKYNKLTLGINPGSTYGSAKRWYPSEFSKVAIQMSTSHDIIIFGGANEKEIAKDIESELKQNSITNYKNLAGKTSIQELIESIAGLDIFITNDSGPMHIAAAYKIPTISIFGPTRYNETSQWNNPNGIIITKDLKCAPCMKRVCPLVHHDCMKLIIASDVLDKLSKFR